MPYSNAWAATPPHASTAGLDAGRSSVDRQFSMSGTFSPEVQNSLDVINKYIRGEPLLPRPGGGGGPPVGLSLFDELPPSAAGGGAAATPVHDNRQLFSGTRDPSGSTPALPLGSVDRNGGGNAAATSNTAAPVGAIGVLAAAGIGGTTPIHRAANASAGDAVADTTADTTAVAVAGGMSYVASVNANGGGGGGASVTTPRSQLLRRQGSQSVQPPPPPPQQQQPVFPRKPFEFTPQSSPVSAPGSCRRTHPARHVHSHGAHQQNAAKLASPPSGSLASFDPSCTFKSISPHRQSAGGAVAAAGAGVGRQVPTPPPPQQQQQQQHTFPHRPASSLLAAASPMPGAGGAAGAPPLQPVSSVHGVGGGGADVSAAAVPISQHTSQASSAAPVTAATPPSAPAPTPSLGAFEHQSVSVPIAPASSTTSLGAPQVPPQPHASAGMSVSSSAAASRAHAGSISGVMMPASAASMHSQHSTHPPASGSIGDVFNTAPPSAGAGVPRTASGVVDAAALASDIPRYRTLGLVEVVNYLRWHYSTDKEAEAKLLENGEGLATLAEDEVVALTECFTEDLLQLKRAGEDTVVAAANSVVSNVSSAAAAAAAPPPPQQQPPVRNTRTPSRDLDVYASSVSAASAPSPTIEAPQEPVVRQHIRGERSVGIAQPPPRAAPSSAASIDINAADAIELTNQPSATSSAAGVALAPASEATATAVPEGAPVDINSQTAAAAADTSATYLTSTIAAAAAVAGAAPPAEDEAASAAGEQALLIAEENASREASPAPQPHEAPPAQAVPYNSVGEASLPTTAPAPEHVVLDAPAPGAEGDEGDDEDIVSQETEQSDQYTMSRSPSPMPEENLAQPRRKVVVAAKGRGGRPPAVTPAAGPSPTPAPAASTPIPPSHGRASPVYKTPPTPPYQPAAVKHPQSHAVVGAGTPAARPHTPQPQQPTPDRQQQQTPPPPPPSQQQQQLPPQSFPAHKGPPSAGPPPTQTSAQAPGASAAAVPPAHTPQPPQPAPSGSVVNQAAIRQEIAHLIPKLGSLNVLKYHSTSSGRGMRWLAIDVAGERGLFLMVSRTHPPKAGDSRTAPLATLTAVSTGAQNPHLLDEKTWARHRASGAATKGLAVKGLSSGERLSPDNCFSLRFGSALGGDRETYNFYSGDAKLHLWTTFFNLVAQFNAAQGQAQREHQQ